MLAIFLGFFAANSFTGPGDGFERVRDAMMHLLPALACLLIVVVAWRKAWIGALAFTVLAVLYALWAAHRPDQVLTISGPLAVVALLYALAWWLRPRA
ncbi:MAG: hypothetical protein GFGODING_00522 [Flavobacteriales bacterium]|nr:hypothetical protein [Flavobacteriales bacterium]